MLAPAHSMEFLINDDSGSVRAIMSPKAMESSSHLADAPAKLGMCDNTQSIQLEKFQDLDAGGYFMLLCSWPMGSDVPLIMCAMPLGEQLQHRGLYVEALMNTRRKLAIDDLDRLSGGGAEKIVQESAHLGTDRSGRWVYYREPEWDEDAFSFLAAREFKKPKLSEVFKSGISRMLLTDVIA